MILICIKLSCTLDIDNGENRFELTNAASPVIKVEIVALITATLVTSVKVAAGLVTFMRAKLAFVNI